MEAHPDDSSLVSSVVDHIENHSDRLPDGTFARLTPDSMTVWADDLFMGSVILSRSASVFARPELIDEVANQIILFDQHLKDQESGLYWHGWFNTTQTPSSSKWARANGWTMVAKMFALEVIPDDHPKRNEVLRIFADHATALKNVQSADGRYHQILDNPDTYLETSATAMFTAAFATGVNNGWLDRDEFDESIRKGWAAVTQQVDEDGNVEGIVRGTPIMFSDQAYHEHPPRKNDPRGLGAILYCAAAMDAYLN
jgi:rhamnogalacturonyl hydrolase YesR